MSRLLWSDGYSNSPGILHMTLWNQVQGLSFSSCCQLCWSTNPWQNVLVRRRTSYEHLKLILFLRPSSHNKPYSNTILQVSADWPLISWGHSMRTSTACFMWWQQHSCSFTYFKIHILKMWSFLNIHSIHLLITHRHTYKKTKLRGP
jgi:hypothetical protein